MGVWFVRVVTFGKWVTNSLDLNLAAFTHEAKGRRHHAPSHLTPHPLSQQQTTRHGKTALTRAMSMLRPAAGVGVDSARGATGPCNVFDPLQWGFRLVCCCRIIAGFRLGAGGLSYFLALALCNLMFHAVSWL